jgi:3-deoxy-7-phosphoheptulonate synthase
MIVIMKPGVSLKEVSAVIKCAEERGVKPHVSRNGERTIVGLMGGPALDRQLLMELSGVEDVVPIRRPFKLASREFRNENTVVKVNGITVGGNEVVIMAGPCAVESRDQTLTAARAVREAGARILRGGAYKPRTSPYSFQGMGEKGLEILAEARAETGLALVTEVVSPDLVELVSRYADILQVGARNMQNYALLEAVGRARKPVLLKRGMMSTVEELLMSAEYILSQGNSQVILCERGIRTFEKVTRNTMDISAVPAIKQLSHLPIIVDPSHATGDRELVASLAAAGIAAGADGIIVEVHPCPDEALCDGRQSLDLLHFARMMEQLRRVADAVGRTL